jgi:hypothetical protein
MKNHRNGFFQIAVDVALALGLIAVLGLVFLVDRNSPPIEQPRRDTGLKVVETSEPDDAGEVSASVKPLRLGVTPDAHAARDPLDSVQVYDDMGKLLDTLGEGYKHQAFPLEDLSDGNKLAEYDVVFLTCSTAPQSWLGEAGGAGERPGTQQFTPNEEVLGQVAKNLQEFVSRGGTLYASDFHFPLLMRAFPDMIDVHASAKGTVQSVQAEVVDDGLRELIGGKMDLAFDMPGWFAAAFTGKDVSVYLRGKFQTEPSGEQTAPLLVKFPYKDGTVIFTSFHNEKQNNAQELALLKYLVFSAMTAGVESRVRRTMVEGGFSPAKQNLFSASSEGNQSATSVYHCQQAGHLKFVLGFQGEGAELKLSVTGPDGKQLEKRGTSTVTIDVPDAQPGDWHYTITAIKLPSPNFPFTVTIGEK